MNFEEIWELAERLSPTTTHKEDLIDYIKDLLEEYYDYDKLQLTNINQLRQKKFGEILFKLAELSKLDNVNIFAALQLEIKH